MTFLLYLFILLLPLGELIRIDLGNSLIIKPLDVTAVLLIIVTFLHYFKKPGELTKKKIFLPLIAFIGSCFLSLLLNIPLLNNLQFLISSLYLFRFIGYVSIYLLLADYSSQKKKKLAIVFIAINILLLIGGFIQFAYYTNLINLSYLGWDRHWLRLYATFFDPNFAGIYFDLFFLYILDLLLKPLQTVRRSFRMTGYISILIITLIGILLTFSRSAFIALAIGLFAYTVFSKKSRKIILFFGSLLLIGIGIITLNAKTTEGTKLFRSISSLERLQSYKAGWYIFTKQPLFGVGFNAYRYAQFRYKTASSVNWQISHSNAGLDNSFLFILGTTGIVGFSAFVWFIIRGLKMTKYSPAAAAVILILCAGSFFINAFFYSEIMAIFWIILGLEKSL